MKGTELYENKYRQMGLDRAKKQDPKFLLVGFYNYLATSKSPVTSYNYLCHVVSFVSSLDKNPSEIDIDDYNAFLVSLKTKCSNYQICAYHSLQKYSKYLKAKGICEDHMMFVDRPKFVETQDTKERREKGWLNKKETKKMIDLASKTSKRNQDYSGVRDKALVMILLNTGIRRAALYKMDVDDIELEEGYIKVLEKGSKWRKIYISEKTIDAIQEWLKVRVILLGGDTTEKALFVSNRRKRMTTQTICRIVKEIGDKVDPDKNVTPHKLRGTYATHLYDNKKDVYFVQNCMGHSTPAVTELYIRGQNEDAMKEAAKVMGKFME